MKNWNYWNAVDRLISAAKHYEEIDEAYVDLCNFLPQYVGSIFPNAPPPNRVDAKLRDLAPKLEKARVNLIQAIDLARERLTE